MRSHQAGHGRVLNVHRESKGESITQNANWLTTGQKPAVPAAVSRQRYQQRKQKQQQQQAQQQQQTAQKPASTSSKKPPAQPQNTNASVSSGKAANAVNGQDLSGKMLETCQAVEAKTVTRKTEKMTLVNENGDIILEKGGTRGSVYFGDYEASLMGPNVTLTHNHPGEFGGTFSGADVRVLTRNDLRAIRAVGKEGTYSLEKTSRTMGLKASAFNEEYSKLSERVVRDLSSEKKVWQRKANKGLVTVEDANRHLAEHRNKLCNEMHDWLVQNAPKYTYNYVFEPAGGVGKMYDIEKEDAEQTAGEYALDGELYSGDDWMIKDGVSDD